MENQPPPRTEAQSDADIEHEELAAEYRSREHLYGLIQDGVRYVLATYGGGADAWRSAELQDLITAVMKFLRAGLGPAMRSFAIEGSVAWLRQYVPAEVIAEIQERAKEAAR